MRRACWLAVLLALSSARADLVDSLDTTTNFFNSFGGTYASNNLDGTVTLLRTVANQDAGIDWRKGAQNLDLATEFDLSIAPVAAFNGGYWNASVLFFSNGVFVAEQTWVADNNLPDLRSTNVLAFADTSGVGAGNVTEYFVRLRVQPFDQQNVGFTFTSISAVPEPRTLLLLGLGGAAGLARRLRRRR